jgi:hypothetical protein
MKVSLTGSGMVVRDSLQVLRTILPMLRRFDILMTLLEWRSDGLSKDSIGALVSCLGCLFFGLPFSGSGVDIDIERQHIEWR